MKTAVKIALASILCATAAVSFASTTGATQVTLEGTYTPGNEATLIKQLEAKGFVDFLSYQRNPDGSAVINAMDSKASVEPILTINVAANGRAVETVPAWPAS